MNKNIRNSDSYLFTAISSEKSDELVKILSTLATRIRKQFPNLVLKIKRFGRNPNRKEQGIGRQFCPIPKSTSWDYYLYVYDPSFSEEEERNSKYIHARFVEKATIHLFLGIALPFLKVHSDQITGINVSYSEALSEVLS